MKIVSNAKTYDWPTWFIGILRSFLSGGAAALTTGTGGAVLGIPGPMVWKLILINFVLMGLYRMGEFLQLHGAPDPVLQAALADAKAASDMTSQKIADIQAIPSPTDPKT
jgi:hypothetical protein